MVVCRMTLMVCKKKRSEIEKKTKWWKLKKEECCEEFRQKLRQALGGQVVLPDDWETTAEVIRETGRKVLGVSSGRSKEDKETWWWNEEVQDSIQRKRSRGACAYLRRHWASRQDTPWMECQPIAGHTYTHSLIHSRNHTHYGQFRDANQPTMHVFGLGEGTGVPGGNPRGTGRTCNLHTHGGGGNQTPNPGGV
ncbi:hypothetical protein QTP86_030721, partial [Hemibagrus guttatus]